MAALSKQQMAANYTISNAFRSHESVKLMKTEDFLLLVILKNRLMLTEATFR